MTIEALRGWAWCAERGGASDIDDAVSMARLEAAERARLVDVRLGTVSLTIPGHRLARERALRRSRRPA